MKYKAQGLVNRLIDFAVRVVNVVEAMPVQRQDDTPEVNLFGGVVRRSPGRGISKRFCSQVNLWLKELRETGIWLKMIERKPLCPPNRLG